MKDDTKEAIKMFVGAYISILALLLDALFLLWLVSQLHTGISSGNWVQILVSVLLIPFTVILIVVLIAMRA